MSNFRNKPKASTRRRAEQAEQTLRGTNSEARSDGYRVSSTWTGQVGVTDRELEVLELYLGEELDRLLSLRRGPRARGPP